MHYDVTLAPIHEEHRVLLAKLLEHKFGERKPAITKILVQPGDLTMVVGPDPDICIEIAGAVDEGIEQAVVDLAEVRTLYQAGDVLGAHSRVHGLIDRGIAPETLRTLPLDALQTFARISAEVAKLQRVLQTTQAFILLTWSCALFTAREHEEDLVAIVLNQKQWLEHWDRATKAIEDDRFFTANAELEACAKFCTYGNAEAATLAVFAMREALKNLPSGKPTK